MDEHLQHRAHLRAALRLGLLGLGLIILAMITPREGSHTGESLWTVARDSTWQKLGDWPAASASLQIMLGSCGLLFLMLAGRQLWSAWFAPRFLHWLLFLLSIAPFVTLVVGFYYSDQGGVLNRSGQRKSCWEILPAAFEIQIVGAPK